MRNGYLEENPFLSLTMSPTATRIGLERLDHSSVMDIARRAIDGDIDSLRRINYLTRSNAFSNEILSTGVSLELGDSEKRTIMQAVIIAIMAAVTYITVRATSSSSGGSGGGGSGGGVTYQTVVTRITSAPLGSQTDGLARRMTSTTTRLHDNVSNLSDGAQSALARGIDSMPDDAISISDMSKIFDDLVKEYEDAEKAKNKAKIEEAKSKLKNSLEVALNGIDPKMFKDIFKEILAGNQVDVKNRLENAHANIFTELTIKELNHLPALRARYLHSSVDTGGTLNALIAFLKHLSGFVSVITDLAVGTTYKADDITSESDADAYIERMESAIDLCKQNLVSFLVGVGGQIKGYEGDPNVSLLGAATELSGSLQNIFSQLSEYFEVLPEEDPALSIEALNSNAELFVKGTHQLCELADKFDSKAIKLISDLGALLKDEVGDVDAHGKVTAKILSLSEDSTRISRLKEINSTISVIKPLIQIARFGLVGLAGLMKKEDMFSAAADRLYKTPTNSLVSVERVNSAIAEYLSTIASIPSTESFMNTPRLVNEADPFTLNNYVPSHLIARAVASEQFDDLAHRVSNGRASDRDFIALKAMARPLGLQPIQFGRTVASQSVALEALGMALKVGAGAAIIGVLIAVIMKFLKKSSGGDGSSDSVEATTEAVTTVTTPPATPRTLVGFDFIVGLGKIEGDDVAEAADKVVKDLETKKPKITAAQKEKVRASFTKLHGHLKALGIEDMKKSGLEDALANKSAIEALTTLGTKDLIAKSYPNLRLAFLNKDIPNEGVDLFVKTVKDGLDPTLRAYASILEFLATKDKASGAELIKLIDVDAPAEIDALVEGEGDRHTGKIPFSRPSTHDADVAASEAEWTKLLKGAENIKAAFTPLDEGSSEIDTTYMLKAFNAISNKPEGLYKQLQDLLDDDSTRKSMEEALVAFKGNDGVLESIRAKIKALEASPDVNEVKSRDNIVFIKACIRSLDDITKGIKLPIITLAGSKVRINGLGTMAKKIDKDIKNLATSANDFGKLVKGVMEGTYTPSPESYAPPVNVFSRSSSLVSLENIGFQSKDLYVKLRQGFDYLITDGTYSTDAILESGIASNVKSATNIDLTFLVNSKVGLNAYLMLPTLDKNHPFIHEAYRKRIDAESGRLLASLAGKLPKGSVDTKLAKVDGIFTKIPMEVHYGLDLIRNTSLTVGEKVAIFLHELGHAFTYFLHLGQTVTSGLFAGAIAKEIMDAKSYGERIVVLEEAERTLGIEIPTKESLAKGRPQDSSKAVQVVYLSQQAEKNRTETGHNYYEVRACEQIADQFAVRMGAGKDLALAMAKLYRLTGHSSAFNMSFHVITEVGKLILFIAGIILITPGILMIMYILLVNPYEKSYDSPEQRVELIRRMLSNRLKDRTLPPSVKAEIQSDLALIDQVMVNLSDKKTLVELFWKYAMNKGATASDQEELNKQIEAFVYNRLHEEAAAYTLL